MASVINYLANYTEETLFIFYSLLLICVAGFVAVWFLNRRKYHQLTHQIPANIVKNYLDSIIQNSNALKSSLFRGGGLEVGAGLGVPSVVPVSELGAGVGKGPTPEELEQKNAEIASLRSSLSDKDIQIGDLKRKLSSAEATAEASAGGDTAPLQAEISSLQSQLQQAQSDLAAAAANAGSGGGDPELEKKLDEITKERDELKERLREYEIIEEDLANLKRLQQENDDLKKQLAAGAGAAAAAPEPPPAAPEPPPAAPEPPPAAPAEDEGEEDLEALMAAAITDDDKKGIVPEKAEPVEEEKAPEAAAEEPADAPAGEEGEQKSAEELLSEFEKMLG